MKSNRPNHDSPVIGIATIAGSASSSRRLRVPRHGQPEDSQRCSYIDSGREEVKQRNTMRQTRPWQRPFPARIVCGVRRRRATPCGGRYRPSPEVGMLRRQTVGASRLSRTRSPLVPA